MADRKTLQDEQAALAAEEESLMGGSDGFIPFDEEEANLLREDYADKYNKALKSIFRPTVIQPEPTEGQKKQAEALALRELSSKYKSETKYDEGRYPVAKEYLKARIQPPMAEAPTLLFDKVRNPEQAKQQLETLTTKQPGSSIFGPNNTYRELERAPNTPANQEAITRRIAELSPVVEKARKYSPENISNFIKYGNPKQYNITEEEETKPDTKGPTAEVKPGTKEGGKKSGEGISDAAKNTLSTGSSTLSEFEKYKQRMSLTPEEEKQFSETENRLKESLITAREAYSQGMRSTELYKALEKIAEGLVLFGAGLYGTKTGIDAVSGLKFNPIDWSTRTDRLTKELDLAEKQYTKDMESVETKKRGIEKLREEAVRFEEGRKEREERRAERVEGKKTAEAEKTVKAQKEILEGQIKDLDRQINDIREVRTATPKSKDAMQRQYQALATTLGIPESEFMTGMLGGFREGDADAAFLKKQQELIQKRAQLEKQLRGETPPAPKTGTRTPEEEAELAKLYAKRDGTK